MTENEYYPRELQTTLSVKQILWILISIVVIIVGSTYLLQNGALLLGPGGFQP